VQVGKKISLMNQNQLLN